MATVGHITSQVMLGTSKTSMQCSVHHDGEWAIILNADLYRQDTLPAIGAVGGFTLKASAVGTNGKVHKIGYNSADDELQVFTRSGAIRYQRTPYTSGTDTYGTTVGGRIDSGNYDNSGFDSGIAAAVTDQQGNFLIAALGAAADIGTLPQGLLIGYDPANELSAQIEGGFDRTTATNVDMALFNDGSNDYVIIGYINSTTAKRKIAYHITETQANVANYASGWVTEEVDSTGGIDDHMCIRCYGGNFYMVTKNSASNSLYLTNSVGGIDTATNSTTSASTEFVDHGSRPIIVINETTEEMYLFYEDLTSGIHIAYKQQPLSGFSFTAADQGTSFIEKDTDTIGNPNGPAHNVIAAMGTFDIFGLNTTGTDATHFNRFDISGSPPAGGSSKNTPLSFRLGLGL